MIYLRANFKLFLTEVNSIESNLVLIFTKCLLSKLKKLISSWATGRESNRKLSDRTELIKRTAVWINSLYLKIVDWRGGEF